MYSLKRTREKSSRVFISWIISYLVILVIPIIIGVYVYNYSIDTLREEVNKVHFASLKQFGNAMDSKLDEINRISNVLNLNNSVQNLMYGKDKEYREFVLTLYEAQKEISRFNSSNNFIEEIYLYFNNENIILTGTYKYSADEIESLIVEELGLTKKEFAKLNNSKQNNICIIRNERILYIQSLYLSQNIHGQRGLFIAEISKKAADDMLENLEWNSESGIIVVDDNQKYLKSENTLGVYEYLSNKELLEENKIYEKIYQDNEISITYINSDIGNLKYISIIPTKLYYSSSKAITKIIVIYILIYLFIGGVIAIVFARRNYNPVKRLKNMFEKRAGNNKKTMKNEFGYIEDALENLFLENKNLMDSLREQEDTVRDDLIIKLMRGHSENPERISNIIETYEIHFETDIYAVIGYEINKIGEKTFGKNAMDDDKTSRLIKFIIKNVGEEIINESSHHGYIVESEGYMMCLVNLESNDEKPYYESIKSLAKKTMNLLEKNFQIYLTVAISNIHKKISGISEAYNEILEIFEYKLFFELQNDIIEYDYIKYSEEKSYNNYSLDSEKQFINCIYSKDYESAKKILNYVIEKDISNKKQSLKLAKYRMFGLINSLINVLSDIKENADIEIFEEIDPISTLLDTKSISEFKNESNKAFDQIIDYLTKRKEDKEPKWVEKAEEYVISNYNNSELSITLISDSLNMNVSYLSRSYKQYRGEGLLDYLHKVRIEKSKELMAENKYNIKEIAKKIGYLNSKAFIRVFKRYEGTTPGKYMESIN